MKMLMIWLGSWAVENMMNTVSPHLFYNMDHGVSQRTNLPDLKVTGYLHAQGTQRAKFGAILKLLWMTQLKSFGI